LRNHDSALPLSKGLRRIAVIGSHADQGVLSGGGSSQVIPLGGIAVRNLGPAVFPGPLVYVHRSKPSNQRRAQSDYTEGDDIVRSVQMARGADAVIIFAHQWMAEMRDAADLSLPHDQDRLIEAVAAINKNTVVVLETGGPVRMPWLSRTSAVIEAWYPGGRGCKKRSRKRKE
jgi:beta-glucosidase